MRRSVPRNLTVCASLVWLTSLAAAADWPQFRGPDGSGVSNATGLPLTWSGKENIVWQTALPGPGTAAPVVIGNRIFVTCYTGYGLDAKAPGDPGGLKLHLLGIKAQDGTIAWDTPIDPAAPGAPYGGYVAMHGYASSTPAVDADAVYCFWGNTGVSAWSHAGKPLWTTSVGSKTHAWGSGTSPVLHGDLVIVNASVESGALVALDRKTGKEVWRQPGMDMAWDTPTVATCGTRDELVVSVKKWLRAFAPATGAPLWQASGIDDYICPSVVAHDGIFYAIGARKNAAVAVRGGGEGDVSASHVLWRLARGSNVSSPVYHDGHLYWANDTRGTVYCVEAATGKLVYEQTLAPNPGKIYASPIVAEGRIYYVSRERGTYVVAAKPQFELLAHNVIDSDGSVFNACPVPLAPNRLLLRSDRALFCVGGK